MDNFPDRSHLAKLNQDQANNLNIHITPKEIEAVIKTVPTKNPTSFHVTSLGEIRNSWHTPKYNKSNIQKPNSQHQIKWKEI